MSLVGVGRGGGGRRTYLPSSGSGHRESPPRVAGRTASPGRGREGRPLGAAGAGGRVRQEVNPRRCLRPPTRREVGEAGAGEPGRLVVRREDPGADEARSVDDDRSHPRLTPRVPRTPVPKEEPGVYGKDLTDSERTAPRSTPLSRPQVPKGPGKTSDTVGGGQTVTARAPCRTRVRPPGRSDERSEWTTPTSGT